MLHQSIDEAGPDTIGTICFDVREQFRTLCPIFMYPALRQPPNERIDFDVQIEQTLLESIHEMWLRFSQGAVQVKDDGLVHRIIHSGILWLRIVVRWHIHDNLRYG